MMMPPFSKSVILSSGFSMEKHNQTSDQQMLQKRKLAIDDSHITYTGQTDKVSSQKRQRCESNYEGSSQYDGNTLAAGQTAISNKAFSQDFSPNMLKITSIRASDTKFESRDKRRDPAAELELIKTMLESERSKSTQLLDKLTEIQAKLGYYAYVAKGNSPLIPSPLPVKQWGELEQYIVTDISFNASLPQQTNAESPIQLLQSAFANINSNCENVKEPIPFTQTHKATLSDAELSVFKYFMC